MLPIIERNNLVYARDKLYDPKAKKNCIGAKQCVHVLRVPGVGGSIRYRGRLARRVGLRNRRLNVPQRDRRLLHKGRTGSAGSGPDPS